MPASGRILVETSPRGPQFPSLTALTANSANVFGFAPWQVGAAFSTNVTVTIPTLTADTPADVTFQVAWPGFPTFTLQQQASAVAIVNAFPLTSPSDATTVIGPVAIALRFGGGSLAVAQGPSNAVFSLQGGATYRTALLKGTVRALSPAGTSGSQTLQFALQGSLIGRPGGNP